MSRPWVLVLTPDAVRVYDAAAPAARAALTWDPEAPDAVLPSLAAMPRQPSHLVLVVGLAWLEAAPVTLPPVPVGQQRRMLQLDADRWFPIAAPLAVAIADTVGMAMPADLLNRWVRAFATLAPVDAVVTLPQAAWLAGVDGTVQTPAAVGEIGLMEFARGTLRQVRRSRHELSVQVPTLDEGACALAVVRAGPLPLDVQLLDPLVEQRVRARRRGAWWRAASLTVAAAVFCFWSADQWRARTLEEGRVTRDALERIAQGALDADGRRQRAAAERQLLTRPENGHHVSAMLALLGEQLPPDVFVQRAEWDGRGWRLDGSARDAAALVPLLSGLPGVRDVRSLAPSTRFLDGGQPRSSFSIALQMADSTEQVP